MVNLKFIGFSNYDINEKGEVYSHKVNKILSQQISNNGYLVVSITDDKNQRYRLKVHRLLMRVFKPHKDWESLTVNHIDGDKLNNSLSNLEWSTMAEQNLHALSLGLRKTYRKDIYSKVATEHQKLYSNLDDCTLNSKDFNEDSVKNICYLLEQDYSSYDISLMTGFKKSCVQNLKSHRYENWVHITKQYNFRKINKNVMSDSEIHKACELLQEGYSATKVSKIMNKPERSLFKLKRRETHTKISKDYHW